MRKTFKKYFIPHEHNEYKPHILRERAVFALAGMALFLFLGNAFQVTILQKLNLSAEIISSVLTDLANKDRTVYAISSLNINQTLTEAAQLKANDMATKGYFAHTSPEGLSPWYWFRSSGYNFIYAGENLAIDFTDSNDVNSAWLNSPSHRANILNPNFTEIGIATAKGIWQGHDTVFVVQLFGRPAPTFDIESANSVVAGESVEKRQPVETIIENDTFVAVRVADTPTKEIPPISEILPTVSKSIKDAEGAELGASSYASWFEELLASPKKVLSYAYIILASLILLALLLAVFIEVHKQHPKHIVYAILLLVFIGLLFYINHAFLIPEVLVR